MRRNAKPNNKYTYKEIRCPGCSKLEREEDGVREGDQINFLCGRCGCSYTVKPKTVYSEWKNDTTTRSGNISDVSMRAFQKALEREIRECPFCGSNPVLIQEGKEFWVKCRKCECRVKSSKVSDVAIKHWNQRAAKWNPTLAELKDMCEKTANTYLKIGDDGAIQWQGYMINGEGV